MRDSESCPIKSIAHSTAASCGKGQLCAKRTCGSCSNDVRTRGHLFLVRFARDRRRSRETRPSRLTKSLPIRSSFSIGQFFFSLPRRDGAPGLAARNSPEIDAQISSDLRLMEKVSAGQVGDIDSKFFRGCASCHAACAFLSIRAGRGRIFCTLHCRKLFRKSDRIVEIAEIRSKTPNNLVSGMEAPHLARRTGEPAYSIDRTASA